MFDKVSNTQYIIMMYCGVGRVRLWAGDRLKVLSNLFQVESFIDSPETK